MSAEIQIDTRQFESALKFVADNTERALPEILNQRTLNVVGRAFDNTPPASGQGVQAERKRVKDYLGQQVSQRIRQTKRGNFVKKGTKARQLKRVHLILQARRRRMGQRGLYGPAMTAAAGRFMQRAQVSVGYLKSVFLPIIVTLNRVCRFKFPFNKTSNISRWPGSRGSGRVQIARAGMNVETVIATTVEVEARSSGKVAAIQESAMQRALDAEADEMERHVSEKLQEIFDRVKAA